MIDMHELYWAAGFLEGEGSFGCYGRLNNYKVECGQVQREPLERLQRIFGGGIHLKPAKGRHQAIYHWLAQGGRAASVAMTLWALMSPRRKEQIERALTTWKSRPLARAQLARATGVCGRGHRRERDNVYRNRECKQCAAINSLAQRARRRLV